MPILIAVTVFNFAAFMGGSMALFKTVDDEN